jgi:hypothetical protein
MFISFINHFLEFSFFLFSFCFLIFWFHKLILNLILMSSGHFVHFHFSKF